jgi:hypothetical protein
MLLFVNVAYFFCTKEPIIVPVLFNFIVCVVLDELIRLYSMCKIQNCITYARTMSKRLR